MAGINKKLKGATLIETLVAMVLLVTTISLTFFSVTGIKKSFNNELRTYSYIVLNNYVENDSLYFGNEAIEYPSFTIYRTTEKDEANPFLTKINVRAVSSDSIVLCQITKYMKINDYKSKKNNE